MMAKFLSRSIQVLCVSGMALGMTTAMAQGPSVMSQYVETGHGDHLVVVAYSDPESEVSNGTKPKKSIATNHESEPSEDIDVPMEADNFPEGEVGNGTFPPDLNP